MKKVSHMKEASNLSFESEGVEPWESYRELDLSIIWKRTRYALFGDEMVTLWEGADSEYAICTCVWVETRGPLCGKSRIEESWKMELGAL